MPTSSRRLRSITLAHLRSTAGSWTVRSSTKVAGVQSPGRLEEQDMDLIFSNWAMLHASGHDRNSPSSSQTLAVPELHPESPLDHQEEFIFVVMLMPDELALEFYQLEYCPFNSPTILGFQYR